MSTPSFFSRNITTTKSDSKESIIRDFFNQEQLHVKTEINNPVAMAVFDLFAMYYGIGNAADKELLKSWGQSYIDLHKTKGVGSMLVLLGERIRVNAISHGRESRREVSGALQAVEMAEVKKRDLLAGLFG